jgi:hypothetical protein
MLASLAGVASASRFPCHLLGKSFGFAILFSQTSPQQLVSEQFSRTALAYWHSLCPT